jgi:diguanylate cyclase (GGDEF)-like protein
VLAARPVPAAVGETAVGLAPCPDRLATAVWVFDVDHSRMLWANAAALEVWSAGSLEELRARDFGADMSAPVARKFRQFQEDCQQPGVRFTEICTHYPHGVPRTMRVTVSGTRLPDGRAALIGEAVDYGGETADMLRSTAALVQTSVMISLYGADGRAFYRNPAARRAVESADCLLPSRFVDPRDHEALVGSLATARETRMIAAVRTSAGRRWHEITAVNSADPATGAKAYLISEVDVTELKMMEARASFGATHDELTGLPNLFFVRSSFGERLAATRAASTRAALLFVDLDRFKHVNDTLGHTAGDQLLVRTAHRLNELFGDGEWVARLGGDEFLALMPFEGDDSPVRRRAAEVHQSLSRPVRIGHRELKVTPSVGVALFPEHGEDIGALMQSADAAMYEAKQRGRNRVSYYDCRMREAALARQRLENDLSHALERQELELFFQPRIAMSDERVVGAEALLRWRHPCLGLVPPADFIPLAEETGHIEPIGMWALAEAARRQRCWRAQGYLLTVSINLSPRQLASGSFARQARDVVRGSGGDPRGLELEVTESMLVGDEEAAGQSLKALGDDGFTISIDDFGTGYSNLARLMNYPISTVKIDRSFMSDLARSSAIIELIISMCKTLKMQIVAEGVETTEQLAWLRSRACEQYQGYLYSPPVPAPRFEQILARGASTG